MVCDIQISILKCEPKIGQGCLLSTMDIPNPRRVLAVSQPNSGLLDLVQGLTGSAPSLNNHIVAGTTHDWEIKTNYYTATIPIWLDEIESPLAWSNEFLNPEAREVLQALGAFIVCFKKPTDLTGLAEVKSLLENVGRVIKKGCGLMWDGVCLAVAMPQSSTPYLEKSFDEWEELCQESGFEFVDFAMKGRNEFSEPLGLERLKEALQSNDWENPLQLGESLDIDEFDEFDQNKDDLSCGLQSEAAQMEMELRALKISIHDNEEVRDTTVEFDDNDDKEVEKLEAMMLKMQTIRDMSADLPHFERKKLAAKAINEVMKHF